ncbi:glycosyltransferase [Pedobacter sp. KR3-3]|uniref:Glycosyltransferase n=1 Tax=Pedobacter albus TaxID=3113905 RepID=A0ABU7I6N8_9SPHI|nr:glycosyltransferase [Pedobacter sp. KR3-3]MEE1945145.1 glycosyltransferase [Pedobacter sp. KR3-3]
MKIFLSFLQSKQQHPIAAYSFWEYYIKNGIEEAGHEWIECADIDWAKGLVPQPKAEFNDWKNASWEKTIKFLKQNRPDVWLSYLYPEQVDTGAIEEIKKMGIFCINFFCDNIRLFKKAPQAFGVFDLNWVPEYEAIGMYEKAQFRHINLPMPMWVAPAFRTVPTAENGRVSFIGSKDIQRQLFFEKLIELNPAIALDIYGQGWQEDKTTSQNRVPSNTVLDKIGNQFRFVAKHGLKAYKNKLSFGTFNPQASTALKALIRTKPDFEQYIRITRESEITLGINRYPSFDYPLYRPNTYSRLRDIEAPMLGACYLTEWAEGLDKLYDMGTEIETFRNEEQLIEKIKELASNPSKRAMLRTNGQKRALSKNSIVESLSQIKNLLT